MLAPDHDALVQRWCQGEAARQMPVQLSPFKHPLAWTTDLHPHHAMVPAVVLQRLTSAVA